MHKRQIAQRFAAYVEELAKAGKPVRSDRTDVTDLLRDGLHPLVNSTVYSAPMLSTAILAVVLVNAWTILRFWQDKQRAIAGNRRIPEGSLLGLALIGGSPGALLARHLFRHKTRKQPFSTQLFVIVAVQIGLLAGFFLL